MMSKNLVLSLAMGFFASIVVLLVGGAPAPAQELVIFSFEDGTNPGFEAFSGNPAAPVGTSATGATDGSLALEVNAPSGFSQGLNFVVDSEAVLYSQILNATQYAFDFTVVGSSETSTFFQARPFLNYRSNTDGFPFVEGAFVGLGQGQDGTVTAIVDIPSDLAPLDHPNGFFMRLGVTSNGDAAYTYYLDRVRLIGVPEPASLALFGLALPAIALAARRRR